MSEFERARRGWIALSLFTVGCLATTQMTCAKQVSPIAATRFGPVRGTVEQDISVFKGIPYAAPPVGNLRWMPPASPAHHALLDATEFANTCPQVTELGAFAGPSSTTEDCL